MCDFKEKYEKYKIKNKVIESKIGGTKMMTCKNRIYCYN